jgi:hypothetical protein
MKHKLLISALALPLLFAACKKKTDTDVQIDKATSELKAAVENANANLTDDQKKALKNAQKQLENLTDDQKQQLADMQKQGEAALKEAGSDVVAAQKAAQDAAKEIQDAQDKAAKEAGK